MYKRIFRLQHLLASFLLVALISSCVDSQTDYESIDKNIQVSVNDLKFKFGTTEKIMLRDLLKVSGNLNSDANNLYNIVNTGERNFSYLIDPILVQIPEQHFAIPANLLQNYLPLATKPRTRSLGFTTDYIPFNVEGDLKMAVEWKSAIKAVERIDLQNTNMGLAFALTGADAQKFAIVGLEGLTITMPSFIKSKQLGAGNVLNVPNFTSTQGVQMVSLGNVTVDAVAFDQALANGSQPEGIFKVQGKVKLTLQSNTTLTSSTDLTSEVILTVNGNGTAMPEATSMRGVFSYPVNAGQMSFSIKNELPEGLDPDSLRLTPTNVTVRLNADMTQIPVGFVVQNAEISGKYGTGTKSESLLQAPITLDKRQGNIVYLYQGNTPYDTEAIAPTAKLAKVNGFDTLLESVPDSLTFKFAQDDVQLKQETTTIEFGKTYDVNVSYKLFVPFAFDKGLKIYYDRSTDSLTWNTNDWKADKLIIEVNGTAESTIPLDIDLQVEALDKDGKVLDLKLDGIHVNASTNDQPTETTIQIKSNEVSSNVVKSIDRFRFVAKGNAEGDNNSLRSNQYLQLKDAKVKVSGKVLIDLNNN